MRSVKEIGEIFIDEAKKALDDEFDNILKTTNKILNTKDENEVEKEYAFLCNTLSNRLPKRGITEAELKSFIPYIKDYQGEITKYILQKLIKKGDN